MFHYNEEDTTARKEGLDDVSLRVSGMDRIVLGWGGIDNYYKIVPPRIMSRIKEIHRGNTLKYKAKKAVQAEELLNTLQEIEEEDAEEIDRMHSPAPGGRQGFDMSGGGGDNGGRGDGDSGSGGGGGGGNRNKREGAWKQVYGGAFQVESG